jgi:hypothetical protein
VVREWGGGRDWVESKKGKVIKWRGDQREGVVVERGWCWGRAIGVIFSIFPWTTPDTLLVQRKLIAQLRFFNIDFLSLISKGFFH